MEALEPHGGGGLHASTLRPPYSASSSVGVPDTPTPNRWPSEELGPLIDLGIAPPEPRLNRTPDRVTEARNGIKRKASQVLGRPTLDTGILDTSKALAGLLAQVQNAYQDRLEQIQAQLTEELQSWKAEQQTREDLHTERITALEREVTRLRKELEEAQQTSQKHDATTQSTQGAPATQTSHRILNQAHSQTQSQPPKPTPKPGQKQSSFADIAALLAIKPGGQGWQEVPQKRKQQRSAETTKKPEPGYLKPARDSPKEARRILFRR
jgi:flagellar motility protein MotE (MotC chaperone)